MKKIPVMEIFGPTIQGEGMVIGQKTMFVRTGGCDYRCSWCDSAFTWDGTGKSNLMTAEDIIKQLKEIGGDRFSHVTISGGNPAIHQGIGKLVSSLKSLGIKTAVETQGSLWQEWMMEVSDVTISPKPPSSKMETDYDKLDYYIDRLKDQHVSLKVVVFNEGDLEYAKHIHERYPEIPMYLQVGNDEVESVENDSLISHLLDRYEWLIDQAVASETLNDVKVLPQLHTLVWGNKRGV
ncbi:7-carboxy-7-deazaguanine synthase QueE [Alkalihalophilus marmarensis]|jgi:7-carboxy-7-deazaguanine synthase|uniref:7-carboxy-7-deazaguanine synthase n=1 Tax=Alkalihalophilus marmarensis DSM 21297 TaxID=1188261 RepID=U6SS25_9BACI|nr:7-carboxy-7-deazaguanine synthase QueE [Alkalihalophilus marmarensis]ERN53436.1 7-carboxy-7-deazaguanine synthase [Alkalihalophilus marmarensis DSM 21297]MCM3490893.1 7-carboxy-7-deazaguanine synthase QueE [Alkalihalophilus marmarensis]